MDTATETTAIVEILPIVVGQPLDTRPRPRQWTGRYGQVTLRHGADGPEYWCESRTQPPRALRSAWEAMTWVSIGMLPADAPPVPMCSLALEVTVIHGH